MDDTELAGILREIYANAKRNETVCQIHLFGINYAHELQSGSYSLKHILELSGISMGYLSEISKGVKLSKYVQLREEDLSDG
ncbi:MAG: hypothetical protein VB078_02510 [Clostridiaceae bacterium]|nr:hypothetical protein [Clostridiaceae bacterium]